MDEPHILALDLGTSGCRAVVYDRVGQRLGEHYGEYETLHRAPGGAEQRPDDWWQVSCECIRAALHRAGDVAHSVVALGISAQGHSWAPLDESHAPLRPALTWLDTRATPHAAALLAAKGAAFWGKYAGKLPGAWHLLPQLLWLREAEPQIAAEARHLVFAHDYLLHRLTGTARNDFTTAAGCLLLDIRRFRYNGELLAEYAVPPDALSPLCAAGTVAGHLTPEAAEATGLPAHVIVAVGAQDQKCAALGAGIGEGVATASLGTATAITAQTPKPGFSAKTPIPCFPYLSERTWVLEAPLVTSGAAYRWLRGIFREGVDAAGLSGEARVSYPMMDALAADSPPGANGAQFLPFLAGAGSPHWQGDARAAFAGLHLDTHLSDMTRAVMEGVAFEMRTNLEAMRDLGAPLEALRVFGGGARSHIWVQMIADVLRLPVELCADVEAAATGAAILAAVAAGLFPDLGAAQSVFVARTRRFDPRNEAAIYEELYRQYCATRKKLLA